MATPQLRVLSEAPAELTRGRLRRLGEGIGKVVYASEHWVVKRERTPSEVVALIGIWRLVRFLERILPFGLGRDLLERPSRQLRLLRVAAQASMAVLPRTVWFSTHIRQVWRQYHFQSARGERLAREHLQGTSLVPEEVAFPSVRVSVGGWPGFLTVSKATERVEAILYARLTALAAADGFAEFEHWLEQLLLTRQSGWRLGLFSLDAHLRNYGIVQGRVVLIDPGGLTNQLADIEEKLARELGGAAPHVRLGLESLLADHPEIAARFDARWRDAVNPAVLRELWAKDRPAVTPLESPPPPASPAGAGTPASPGSRPLAESPPAGPPARSAAPSHRRPPAG